jgi:MoxR-like ATPase
VSGRSYVAPEDIQAAVGPVLLHRLPAQFDESVIEGIVSSVPVPVGHD